MIDQHSDYLQDDIIADAVVTTLENRPNYSCKIDSICLEVLHALGITLRGNKRSEFDAKLKSILVSLIRSKVIEKYKAKNIRIKLEKDYEVRFTKFKSRLQAKSSNININMPDEVTCDYENDIYTLVGTLATLPDIDCTDSHNDAIGDAYEEDNLEDDTDALNRLINPNKATSCVVAINEATHVSPTIISNNILNKIANNLEPILNTKAKRHLNELTFNVDVPGKLLNIPVIISYSRERQIIFVKSIIPFSDKSAIPLLELFGSNDYTTTLGIQYFKGVRSYIIKKAIVTAHDDDGSIIDIVLEVVKEAINAAELVVGIK